VACYSLIDAGRKGVTTGSETKDFIPHSRISSCRALVRALQKARKEGEKEGRGLGGD
jgi:hypothetical protein